MNNKKTIIAFFIAAVFLSGFNTTFAKSEKKYDAEYRDSILKLVVPTNTMATIIEDCNLRTEPSIFSPTADELKKGALVEILQDSSEKWYKVEYGDEEAAGWVIAKFLNIHADTRTELPDMSKEELEAFVNIFDFPTNSDYFIWTDIARQKTHVFKKESGYTLIKTFICSTGRSETPTTRGFFTINGRGKWFYSKRFESGARYWVRFNGTYLFHSVAMDKNKNIIDGVLGERRSSGCVRLSVSNALWLYENIPDGTSVFIH